MEMVDLLLTTFLVEVAPVSSRDQEFEWFQLRMDAPGSVEEISVQRVLHRKPDARETVTVLP